MSYIFETVTGNASALAFKFNGQVSIKNYDVEIVNGNRLKVVSTQNEMFSLLEADVSEVDINGTVYSDPLAAQFALKALVSSTNEPVVMTKEMYLELAAAVQVADRGIILPDTPVPVDGWQPGWYTAGKFENDNPGTNYPNQNNLKAKKGFITKFLLTGGVWNFVEWEMPQASPNLRIWEDLVPGDFPLPAKSQVIKDNVQYIAPNGADSGDVPGVNDKWEALGGKQIADYVAFPKIITDKSGFWSTDGDLVVSGIYWHSEQYPTKELIEFKNPFQGAGIAAQVVFFDANGNFLSSQQNQSVIVSPSGAAYVAFSSQTKDLEIATNGEYWRFYDSLTLNNRLSNFLEKKKNLLEGISFTPNKYLLETGHENDSNGLRIYDFIPVRKGLLNLKNLPASAFIYSILYDENKNIVGRVNNDAVNKIISVPEYAAFIRISGNADTSMSSDIDMTQSVKSLPKNITQIKSNEILSLGNSTKISFKFRLKYDPNANSDTYKVVTGAVMDLELKNGLTSPGSNRQIPVLNHSVKFSSYLSSSTPLSVGDDNVRMFEGKELFWLRHTGVNYNLFWEVKNQFLNLYEGTTLLKSYSFSIFDTVGKLINAIKSDINNSLIPAFEIFASNNSLTPTSEISAFEKQPAFKKTVPRDTIPAKDTCFPVYFHRIDRKWHLVEMIVKENGTVFTIDGRVYPYGFTSTKISLGGEVIFDFDHFDYKDLEISDKMEYGFPIVRTVYIHGAVDGIGETDNVNNTVDRTLEVNQLFTDRGFQSISYTDFMKHLKFGDPIPKKSFILCYDDSRNELYTDINVRHKLMLNNIKVNNCVVLNFSNDEEIYIKSSNVTTNMNVGDYVVGEFLSKITYLGTSRINPAERVFKLANPTELRDYSDSIQLSKNYTRNGLNLNFSEISYNVKDLEVKPSEFSPLIQDLPTILNRQGFETHIHDYRHEEALDTMTYAEALDNVKKANNLYIRRYKDMSTGIVFSYGYSTVDHARIWRNEGVFLCYTSSQNPQQLGVLSVNNYWMDRESLDHGSPAINYFAANNNSSLDQFLLD